MLNVHKNHKAYSGWGEGGMEVLSCCFTSTDARWPIREEGDYIYKPIVALSPPE